MLELEGEWLFFPYHTNELDKLQPNGNHNRVLEVIDRTDYFVVAFE